MENGADLGGEMSFPRRLAGLPLSDGEKLRPPEGARSRAAAPLC